MPKLTIQSKIKPVATIKGHTELTTIPVSLMFGQPNNTAKLNFKMESIGELANSMYDILTERSQSLDYVMRETLSDVKTFFAFDSKLTYTITDVPYTSMASVKLPNIIGLKTNIYEYARKLDGALDLALNVLEFELSGLTKLVAQLLTDRNALGSTRPISAIADLKMHSTDVEKVKNELAPMIGHETKTEYVEYGSIYFSHDEWKDCSRLAVSINQRLNKVRNEKYAKDIKNLTALMDKLIMRVREEVVPKANIEEYSKLIEQTSNNVAFAGAVVHMCQTLIKTLNNHNKILDVEVADYKKNYKKK